MTSPECCPDWVADTYRRDGLQLVDLREPQTVAYPYARGQLDGSDAAMMLAATPSRLLMGFLAADVPDARRHAAQVECLAALEAPTAQSWIGGVGLMFGYAPGWDVDHRRPPSEYQGLLPRERKALRRSRLDVVAADPYGDEWLTGVFEGGRALSVLFAPLPGSCPSLVLRSALDARHAAAALIGADAVRRNPGGFDWWHGRCLPFGATEASGRLVAVPWRPRPDESEDVPYEEQI